MIEARDNWWTSCLCGRVGGGRPYICVFGLVFLVFLLCLDELQPFQPDYAARRARERL